MLTYQVTSNQARVIDGLGVFAADEPQIFTQAQADWFRTLKGVPLNQDNVPEGVEVTILVLPDEVADELDEHFDKQNKTTEAADENSVTETKKNKGVK